MIPASSIWRNAWRRQGRSESPTLSAIACMVMRPSACSALEDAAVDLRSSSNLAFSPISAA
jgi:hypothetical protein